MLHREPGVDGLAVDRTQGWSSTAKNGRSEHGTTTSGIRLIIDFQDQN
jgi:hypothetical protein